MVDVTHHPALELAAGWHGIGQLDAPHALAAVFALLVALALAAWWIESRSTPEQ